MDYLTYLLSSHASSHQEFIVELAKLQTILHRLLYLIVYWRVCLVIADLAPGLQGKKHVCRTFLLLQSYLIADLKVKS